MSPKDIAVWVPSLSPSPEHEYPREALGSWGRGFWMQGRGSSWGWDESFQLAKTAGSQRPKSFCKPDLPAWETPFCHHVGRGVLNTKCPLHRCTPGGGVSWRLLEQFVQAPPQGVSQ